MTTKMTMTMASFDAVKKEALRKLATAIDKSPKGSVDAPIVDLIAAVNAHENYVTSSSCSGRIAVFCAAHDRNVNEDDDRDNGHLIRKGGVWLLSEHATITVAQLEEALATAQANKDEDAGMVVFKHEPFILHVVCRDVEAAKELLQCGIACGFRESGIVVGNRKVMCAIRTTAGAMEIPIAETPTEWKVDRAYLEWIVAIANERFEANAKKTAQFAKTFQTRFSGAPITAEVITLAACKQLASNDTALHRTGHSCVAVNGKLLVFGGQGQTASGTQSRLADLVEVDVGADGQVTCANIESANAPTARMHHTAVMINNSMVVFGGRAGPNTAFNDVHVFDLATRTWNRVEVDGDEAPKPRWKHGCCAVESTIYVYGGRDNTTVFADLFALDLSSSHPSWRQIGVNEVGIPRFDHVSAVVEQDKLFFWGGMESLEETSIVDNTCCLVFDTRQEQWSKRKLHSMKNAPGPDVIGACACAISDSQVAVCGGVSSRAPVGDRSGMNRMFLLSTPTMEWQPPLTLETPDTAWMNSTCVWIEEQRKVVVVGGGFQCFGFGFVYSPPYICDTTSANVQTSKPHPSSTDSVAKKGNLTPNQHRTDTATLLLGVLAAKAQVKQVKTLLESCHVYDKSRRIHAAPEHQRADGQPLFLLPVSSNVSEAQEANDELRMLEVVKDEDAFANKFGKGTGSNRNDVVRNAILSFARKHHLSDSLQMSVPQHFEFVDDVLMVPRDSFTEAEWSPVAVSMWSDVCRQTTPRLSRVARKAFVDTSEMRQSHVELLYVDPNALPTARAKTQPGWVEVRENGIIYGWDLTKVMFSSGNVTEKARMARMDCRGETIVDLFCGIGYYVLPFLVHGGASFVHACEWNPNSVDALRFNLARNHVAERCAIYEGDNQVTAPQLEAIADRVNLGLLPTSEKAWPLAVACLKPEGGMLHVHDNVAVEDRERWERHVVDTIQQLAIDHGRQWQLTIDHVETVKSYAPKVYHLVMDLRCVAIAVSKV